MTDRNIIKYLTAFSKLTWRTRSFITLALSLTVAGILGVAGSQGTILYLEWVALAAIPVLAVASMDQSEDVLYPIKLSILSALLVPIGTVGALATLTSVSVGEAVMTVLLTVGATGLATVMVTDFTKSVTQKINTQSTYRDSE